MDRRWEKYYAMCSFGKDSIATILLAMEHNEPLDEILYTEVMFDNERGISGEVPVHIEWINNVAIPWFEEHGLKVTRFAAEKDYVSLFKRIRGDRSAPENRGKMSGFPIGHRCWAQGELKVGPIDAFIRKKKQVYEVTQYLGIAVDEPERWDRVKPVKNLNTVSLLIKYGYTEAMATDLCKKYGLLSPIYNSSQRQGCWFCPNQRFSQLSILRKEYPHLWEELKTLSKEENVVGKTFKEGLTIDEIEAKLDDIEMKSDYRNMIWKK